VLAKDRHESRPHVRELALEIALDPNPVNRAVASRLIVPGYTDIVFRMACDDACLAPCAQIQIDDHAPLRHGSFVILLRHKSFGDLVIQ
jgi:hypothetical protein